MKNDNFILKNVKGTFDYMPSEQIIRNQLIDILKVNFELYGYLPLETPILCYFDLLASKYSGGKEILKEVYKLKDQGDRELGLRYDLTVPFAKIIGLEKDLQLPLKRYEIGRVFRDGPVKVGRNREFYQCDVDVCGISSLAVEAEFFQMTEKIFDQLKLDIEIHYNNRNLLTGILTQIGINEGNVAEIILIIDKYEKITKEEIVKELKELGVNDSQIKQLFSLINLDFNGIKNYFSDNINDQLLKGLEEIEELNKYLINLNIKKCIFKPFLARGLEIYTGTVWEIFTADKSYRSSLGGGGRYDKIITSFINDGNIYPAVGMSFGLEPIYEIIKNQNEQNNPVDVLIYAFNDYSSALRIANELRKNNIKSIVEMNGWKLKKTLDYANRNKINIVIILGEDEINNNTFTVKNMTLGEQKNYEIDNLISEINKLLGR